MDVTGKVALVTGAAAGLGLAYVKALLESGVKGVLMSDIVSLSTIKKDLDALGKVYGDSRIKYVCSDVRKKNEFEVAFETAIETYNQLDIVINNAGIINEVNWDQCCSVNLTGTITGTMLAVEKYLPKYKSSDEAVVVNVSSTLGLEPLDCIPVYTATKFGVLGFTRAMGSEARYKLSKVRVFGVCPGRVDTALKQFTNQQIPDPFCAQFSGFFSLGYNQSSKTVANHVINLIRDAPSGSMWKIINDKCSFVEFPHYVIT